MMKDDSALFSVSPDAYAEYLEHLSDAEFWNYAYEKAHTPHSTRSTQALTSIATPPDNMLTCLTCELRTAHCILPLTIIREILLMSQHLTLLPAIPFWMLGILSWRGETIAAIDLCSYLTKNISSPLQDPVILIVQHEGISLALCVLSISSTLTFVNSNQFPPFSLSSTLKEVEVPVGIVGVWEQENAEQKQTLVLDIPALIKDVVQSVCREEG